MNEELQEKSHFSISMQCALKNRVTAARRLGSTDKELAGRNQSDAISILVHRGLSRRWMKAGR